MKIALSGKGGVGKSTITAGLAFILSQHGHKVLAIDADPDANLAASLGIVEKERQRIVTIAQQKGLIEERTGAKVKEYGQIFSLNPNVADIAERFAYRLGDISLLVLGAIERGGGGCACPESALLKALVRDLVLRSNETLLLDMEAGIEHLGRATAMGIDSLIVVLEPGQRSIDSAKKITALAGEIGIADIRLVLNKIRTPDEERFARDALPQFQVLGAIPFRDAFIACDRDGMSALNAMDSVTRNIFEEMAHLLQK